MRSPVSTPAGTVTASVFSWRTRPWPKQVSQGLLMILPRPLQRGQGCWIVKMDCCTRTWPCPLQVSQVLGVEPLAAPVPPQVLHSASVGMRISVRCRTPPAPDRARARSADPRRETPASGCAAAAGENVAEHLAEDVAERIGTAEAAARRLAGRRVRTDRRPARFCGSVSTS
jgi:hypothetical protein